MAKAKAIRYVLAFLLVAAVLWFALQNRNLVTNSIDSLRDASIGWVLVCVAVSIGSLGAMSEVMTRLLRAGGVPVRRRQALALTLSSNSWSTTLPGGPALSTVLQYKVQRDWGASIVVISWFVLLSGAISTLWLVLLGIAAVVFLGASFSLTSLITVTVVMFALAGLVHWLATHPAVLETWARRIVPVFNRLRSKPRDSGLEGVLTHISELQAVQLGPVAFLTVSLYSLGNRLLDLAALWAAVIAVTGDVPAMVPGNSGINIAGITLAYASAKIVGATGVTPGGLGPVEAALTATLVGTGMAAAPALAAALVYRLISFVLITAIGWVVYAVGLKEKP